MTPKQKAALELGQKIRNIVCMDSIARRFFDIDHQTAVRIICDEAMHRLGYESLSEHRKRTSQALMDDLYDSKTYKYQKLPEETRDVGKTSL